MLGQNDNVAYGRLGCLYGMSAVRLVGNEQLIDCLCETWKHHIVVYVKWLILSMLF